MLSNQAAYQAKSVLKHFEDYQRIKIDLGLMPQEDLGAEEALLFSSIQMKSMINEASLWDQRIFTSRYPGVAWLKKLIFIAFTPLMKICLVRQQYFNDHTLALAHAVISLEKRLIALEKELARLNSSSSSSSP